MKNYKIKQLKWNDIVTDLGKKENRFHLLADVDKLSIRFHISNYKSFNSIVLENKYFLSTNINTQIIECDTIDEAKSKAQELFENLIYDLFFEEIFIDPNKELEERIKKCSLLIDMLETDRINKLIDNIDKNFKNQP